MSRTSYRPQEDQDPPSWLGDSSDSRELPQPEDVARFGDDGSCEALCCECHQPMEPDLNRCPHCGAFQLEDAPPDSRWYRQRWLVASVAVLMIVLLLLQFVPLW